MSHNSPYVRWESYDYQTQKEAYLTDVTQNNTPIENQKRDEILKIYYWSDI